jgi:hypothetical protein
VLDDLLEGLLVIFKDFLVVAATLVGSSAFDFASHLQKNFKRFPLDSATHLVHIVKEKVDVEPLLLGSPLPLAICRFKQGSATSRVVLERGEGAGSAVGRERRVGESHGEVVAHEGVVVQTEAVAKHYVLQSCFNYYINPNLPSTYDTISTRLPPNPLSALIPALPETTPIEIVRKDQFYALLLVF